MSTEQIIWKSLGTLCVRRADESYIAPLSPEQLRDTVDQLMKATVPLAVKALPPAPEPESLPSKHVPNIYSSYLGKYLDPESLSLQVDLAVCALRAYTFDAIAFRGMSGALLAPAIAIRLQKTLIMVRKPNDNSHAIYEDHFVEGDKAARTYVIVDDLISSGNTVRTIKAAVRKFAPQAHCLGTLTVNGLERAMERYGKVQLETRP